MDALVPLPNPSPAQCAWLCSVRFTLTPSEDLLGLPPEQEACAFQAVVEELAG